MIFVIPGAVLAALLDCNWFSPGIGYLRIRFTDNAELCWRIISSTLLEEAEPPVRINDSKTTYRRRESPMGERRYTAHKVIYT